jgi:UDP-glucose 4-epimerase
MGEDPKGIPNNLLPYVARVAFGKYDHVSVFGNDYATHDGTGVRDYIHVVDLANAHLKALDRAAQVTGVEHFNIGTGVGYSVLDIIHAFEKAVGHEIKYELCPRRPGDIDECYANPKRLLRFLDGRQFMILIRCALMQQAGRRKILTATENNHD